MGNYDYALTKVPSAQRSREMAFSQLDYTLVCELVTTLTRDISVKATSGKFQTKISVDVVYYTKPVIEGVRRVLEDLGYGVEIEFAYVSTLVEKERVTFNIKW